MLFHIRGPKCFKDLKTVKEKIYDTYKETCSALNLLSDDSYIEKTLIEANYTCSG